MKRLGFVSEVYGFLTATKRAAAALVALSAVLTLPLANASGLTYEYASHCDRFTEPQRSSSTHVAGPHGLDIDPSGDLYALSADGEDVVRTNDRCEVIETWINPSIGVALTVDEKGGVYVAFPGGPLDEIWKFDSQGRKVKTIGGSGSQNGQFVDPYSIDAVGQSLYVSDTLNSRIQQFDLSGNFLGKWGTAGTGLGQFDNALGVAGDSHGNVYVSDSQNNRVQKFSGTGTYITSWGQFGKGAGEFDFPQDIEVAPDGKVLVADTGNKRVQVFDSSGAYLTEIGSSNETGSFTHLFSVTADANGNVYVGASTDKDEDWIIKFSPVKPKIMRPLRDREVEKIAGSMRAYNEIREGCYKTIGNDITPQIPLLDGKARVKVPCGLPAEVKKIPGTREVAHETAGPQPPPLRSEGGRAPWVVAQKIKNHYYVPGTYRLIPKKVLRSTRLATTLKPVSSYADLTQGLGSKGLTRLGRGRLVLILVDGVTGRLLSREIPVTPAQLMMDSPVKENMRSVNR